MFDINLISPLAWILLALGLVAALLFAITGPGRYRQLIRMVRSQNNSRETTVPLSADGLPLRLSVVAMTKGDFHEVRTFLEGIAAQDYPDVEVVIVVDGASRDASNLRDAFADTYPNVRFTFVPPEALNLSRRKLANTIGIKKASGQIILTTLTNIQILSQQWLSLMAMPFTSKEVEIVLGASFMNFNAMTGGSRWYRRFDSLLCAADWMLAAIDGKPYRGDGANLAFRRDLFFRNSGYGNNYYLHAGDDDIFVSQVATAANSRFMFATDATVRVNWGKATARIWMRNKERYAFTEHYLDHSPRLRRSLLNLYCWIGVLAPVSATILTLPKDLIMPLLATAVVLLQWGWQINCYRQLASTFASIRLWWSVPCFYLLRPIADTVFAISHHRHRSANFTWRR